MVGNLNELPRIQVISDICVHVVVLDSQSTYIEFDAIHEQQTTRNTDCKNFSKYSLHIKRDIFTLKHTVASSYSTGRGMPRGGTSAIERHCLVVS